MNCYNIDQNMTFIKTCANCPFYLYEQYVKQADGAIGHKTLQYWREIADDHISLFCPKSPIWAICYIADFWSLPSKILPSWWNVRLLVIFINSLLSQKYFCRTSFVYNILWHWVLVVIHDFHEIHEFHTCV